MHEGMQHDPIQGQGHEPFKVENPAIFKSCLLRHLLWNLAIDHGFLNLVTISKFDRAGFCLVFVSRVSRTHGLMVVLLVRHVIEVVNVH